jgi:hemoglobin
MIQINSSLNNHRKNLLPVELSVVIVALAVALSAATGCHSSKVAKKKDDFFTSGSREADQRAAQTMAKSEQISGSGEGSGEKGAKKAVATKSESQGDTGQTNKAAQVEGKLALFDRLGGEAGIAKIVEDFTPRVMNDPRVNWSRKGVQQGGFSFHRRRSVTWEATPANIATLKKHMEQFIALASGGPTRYDGKEMRMAHADMHIGNPEFDAALGDLKASLDKLQIPNKEQKELLSVIESTRPQIVTQR